MFSMKTLTVALSALAVAALALGSSGCAVIWDEEGDAINGVADVPLVIGGETCVPLGDDPDPGEPATASDPPSLCRHEMFGNLAAHAAYSCSVLPAAPDQARCVIPPIAPNVLSTHVICCPTP